MHMRNTHHRECTQAALHTWLQLCSCTMHRAWAGRTVICSGLDPESPLLSSLLLRKPSQAFSRMLELAKPELVEVEEQALAMFCLFCTCKAGSAGLQKVCMQVRY